MGSGSAKVGQIDPGIDAEARDRAAVLGRVVEDQFTGRTRRKGGPGCRRGIELDHAGSADDGAAAGFRTFDDDCAAVRVELSGIAEIAADDERAAACCHHRSSIDYRTRAGVDDEGRDPGRVDDPAGFIVELEPSAADGAAAHDGFVKIGERDRRAAQMITSGIDAEKATGATFFIPWFASSLASAYAELGKIEDAGRCIGEAMTAAESTKEKWYEAEINRIAGEIALKPPERDTAKAESYFERALTVARQQQAKSWELRAAMSLARLWRDQGKRDEARELLAPVYGWFTEGFETRDLKEAKALLDELGA